MTPRCSRAAQPQFRGPCAATLGGVSLLSYFGNTRASAPTLIGFDR